MNSEINEAILSNKIAIGIGMGICFGIALDAAWSSLQKAQITHFSDE